MATGQPGPELCRLQEMWRNVSACIGYKKHIINMDKLKQCLIDAWSSGLQCENIARTLLTLLSASEKSVYEVVSTHRDDITACTVVQAVI